MIQKQPEPLLKVTIPGRPRPLARPRFTAVCGFARSYDPRSNVQAKAAVSDAVCAAMRDAGIDAPLGGPLAVKVSLYFRWPTNRRVKRWSTLRSKPEQRAVRLYPTVRPDGDNCLKLVLDGLQGYAFDDDKQIVEVSCRKYYTAPTQAERTEVSICRPLWTKQASRALGHRGGLAEIAPVWGD